MRVHIVSHTPLDAAGGVPRFNRYLKGVLEGAGHEVHHWSWWSIPEDIRPRLDMETERADALSRYLMFTRKVERDDVVVGDGFWCGEFTRMGYRRVISVAHGIWSHLTANDVTAGVTPENPWLHATQVHHRRYHTSLGLPIVAVSEFIQEQMRLQWGFPSRVINNAIPTVEVPPFQTSETPISLNNFIIVHGVNDRSNGNKGWAHVEALQESLRGGGYMLLSLDELHQRLGFSDKMQTLQHAHAAFIPSGYEGNSYFALEVMSCDVPVFAYDVGLFRQIKCEGLTPQPGEIVPVDERSVERSVRGFRDMLRNIDVYEPVRCVESVASFEAFRSLWLDVVSEVAGAGPDTGR